MKQPKTKKTIMINSNVDWNDKQQSIFIQYFNKLGLYESTSKDKIVFKLNAQKPTDFLVAGTKRDFFKIIRIVEIKLKKTRNRTISAEIEIDLTHLILISIGLGFSFFLGIFMYLKDLISIRFIVISIFIMTFTFIVGYLSIRAKMKKLEYEFKELDK